ncbi:MAG: flavoprotein, partial [Pyramidobacter sp.]|nr:flavoprotein [Pyramidobacter sp.]
MLKGKKILLGVSGGIAAYKSAALASALVKLGCGVSVLMTRSAQEFITPLTFEAITGRRVHTDTFDRGDPSKVQHIALADEADMILIAPATANVAAKLASGIADDVLTTTALACRTRKVIVPAMNTHMYENPATQENLKKLERWGWYVM